MRILYHHRTLGDGAEGIHVKEMVSALRRLGHEVKVVALIGEDTNAATSKQRRWSRIARLMPGFVYELAEMAYNLKGYATLARETRDFRPDFIYDRYVSYNYAAVGVGRKRGVPVILEVNSPYSYQRQTFDETVHFKRLIRGFERRICRNASRVIAVSTPLKSFLTSIGVPAERIVVMPNGVDPDAFHPRIDGSAVRARLGLVGRLVIGFTGILRPWHGLELLLDAFSTLCRERQDLQLLIVGDGPIRKDIEEEAARRGLGARTTITGRLPHEQVKYHVQAMDVAVSPRATFYASPMKIVEYMGLGKPIVAPDMENIRDLISPGKNGLLFQPEDAGSLADRLRHLLADPAERGRLGLAARRTVENERTWAHNAGAVVRLVEEIQRQLRSREPAAV